MNEKEAREIVSSHLKEAKGDGFDHCGCDECDGASWYLEAIEKAKVLEEAMINLSNSFDPKSYIAEYTKEMLAKWEKEK